MNHDALKDRHSAERDDQPVNLSLRVHRALSWLKRAEQSEDLDGQFIFLWIAFNAAYATEIDDSLRASEKSSFSQFLEKLCDLDTNRSLESLAWTEFPGSIRLLLNNPFVFQAFWDYHNGKISQTDEAEQRGFANAEAHLIPRPQYADESIRAQSRSGG